MTSAPPGAFAKPSPIVRNRTKQLLLDGELALGMGLRQARTVDIAAIAQSADFDWLFIDMEHNSMSVDTAAQICAAALDTGVTPIVRVPGHEHFHASRVLDAGALGIVVPHVNTAEEAQAVVSFCRFPPAGRRSVAGGQPQLRFATLAMAEAVALINDEILVVVMIETPEGVENVDAIAAVPGVDVLLVGGSDLSAEYGIPGEFDHPRIVAAFEKTSAACERNGKILGLGGIYDHAIMERYIKMGSQFILSGSDLSFLVAGARLRSGFLRALDRVPA
ncbi:HpcH/HpaI aldolase family protein [Roseixanthobacter liquoris]|uniref:HpcH/HpaI aldolase family protein n=1 Tax=Roseixanthobacter liquoris TaxID=3119921 RepID=UPI003726DB12